MSETKLWIALTSDCGRNAEEMAIPLKGLPVGVKIGLELFVKDGPSIVETFRGIGFPVFLDLKFHDIPYTVAGAVKAACQQGPELINVHASGGRAMMEAAAEACSSTTRIIAVTVLTSMDTSDLKLLCSTGSPLSVVGNLARAAMESGLHGVVCSPLEAASVRAETSPEFLIVTPGVRPSGSAAMDQKRVMTPAEAIRAGATSLVVGRPVTDDPDPASAAGRILEEIERAHS